MLESPDHSKIFDHSSVFFDELPVYPIILLEPNIRSPYILLQNCRLLAYNVPPLCANGWTCNRPTGMHLAKSSSYGTDKQYCRCDFDKIENDPKVFKSPTACCPNSIFLLRLITSFKEVPLILPKAFGIYYFLK